MSGFQHTGGPATLRVRQAMMDALRDGPQSSSDLRRVCANAGSSQRVNSFVYWFTRDLERFGLVHKRRCPGRSGGFIWVLNTAVRRAA